MSTVEAAASLFAPEGDSGPDPFAVIGNEVTDTTPPQDAEQHTQTSSYPSHMGQDASSLFAEQVYPDAQQDQPDPWSIPTAQDHISRQSHPQAEVPFSHSNQDHHSETTGYDQHPIYATQQVTQTSYGAASTYQPAPAIGYQPYSTNQYSAQQYAASQTPYDPYKPTSTASGSSTYPALQPGVTRPVTIPPQQQLVYDNRNPTARPVSSSYSSPTASQSPLSNGTPVQPTRTLTAAEFRPKMSNAYDPPLPPPKSHRTASPSSIRSFGPSNGIVSNRPYVPAANAYEVMAVPAPPRTMSPSSIRSASPAPELYAPSNNVSAYATTQFRGRSGSDGSTMSSLGPHDAVQPLRKEYGLGFGAHIGEPSSYGSLSTQVVEQDALMPRSARLPYAPSPSLLGTNDPLGRTGSRAPIVSFGFGGKILTCFHGSSDLNTGFDVALSTRRTTNVTIRVLHKILPEHASDAKTADYPGPLLSDPDAPVTSLVRTGSQSKTKKTRVIKYLEERAEEISRGVMYISDGHERQRLNGKLILVQLLKIMVEHDGSLSGSPAIDNAVRMALLPSIAGTLEEPGQDASSPSTFVSPMHSAYSLSSVNQANEEIPISVSILLPSALDKIQEHLVRGERRQAYRFALDQKLWAHAMVIASGIDKEAWKEVVNEFLRVELGAQEAKRAICHVPGNDASPSQTNGREWLRVAYSVYSGQGSNAVQELVSSSLLSRTATTGLHVPAPLFSHMSPMFPTFSSTASTLQIPAESLAHWPEIVASIVASPLNPDWGATLSALGDCLLSYNLVEAAHVCYLLSPQTLGMGGIGGPSARMVLLGLQPLSSNPTFRDADPIILSEIAEFALSLKTPAKGQEPFHGFPHLQAYKLIRASYLADIGHVQIATRYCEAITATMARPSPYFTPTLVEGLRSLADRLIGSPNTDKSSSWISGKVNKPSLDSIGSWLEVRLTKFIAGDGNENSPSPSDPSKANFAGPFSSYSSISSATTSASPSPPPTVVNSYSTPATQPPRRSGSAMALPSTTMHAPIDRASSAMEYYRPVRNASPAPPKTAPLHSTSYPYSAYPARTTTPSMPNAPNGYASAYETERSSRKTSLEITTEETVESQSFGEDEFGQREQQPVREAQDVENMEYNTAAGDSGSWWNSLNNADSSLTPTATTFHQVEHVAESGDGFISLMDDSSLSITPSPIVTTHRRTETSHDDDEDDEDIGLGNRSFKKKQEGSSKVTEDYGQSGSSVPAQEPPRGVEKQDTQPTPASGGSWLSRFWKRSDTPGPIKASLGEETSFYYDKELKRWVNKKAGTEAPPVQALPPPPRAQTASPTVSTSRPNGITNGMAASPQPPPPRTAYAVDLTTSPTAKMPMRVRSNLVPAEVASMPNTPAPGSLPPPTPIPMGRSRSQAPKKNVRSRYVDVFQQDGSAGGV